MSISLIYRNYFKKERDAFILFMIYIMNNKLNQHTPQSPIVT
jgi:hypothetical protein